MVDAEGRVGSVGESWRRRRAGVPPRRLTPVETARLAGLSAGAWERGSRTAARHDLYVAAVALWAEGVALQDIARACGVVAHTVRRWLERASAEGPLPERLPPAPAYLDRDRLTPDVARVPRGSRRVTGAEWSDLLTAAAGFRVGRWATGDLEVRRQQVAAIDRRDQLLVQLWEDRVADAHLADLLGMSEDAIRRARERGRSRGHGTGTRAPAMRQPAPPARPRYRGLTPAEIELLRAAWEHTPDEGIEPYRRKWPGPQMDALLQIIAALHADQVPFETLSRALDAHSQRIGGLVARHRRPLS